MWLVLCHANDAEAVWAFHGLRARGLAPIELVTAESLAFGLQWHHRVSSTGASFEVMLAGGRRIASEQVRGTLNRIQYVPTPHWRSASEKDRDYVQQELFAFLTSCLHSLPGPVLNPAGAQGLSGAPRCQEEWVHHAARAGLPTSVCRRSAMSDDVNDPTSRLLQRTTSWVVGSSVVGAPDGLEEPCRRLASQTCTPLLGIEFTREPGEEWAFGSATHVPALAPGEGDLLDALAEGLTGGERPL